MYYTISSILCSVHSPKQQLRFYISHTHIHMYACQHELIIHRVENMKWVESEGKLKPLGYKTTQFITM